MNLELRVMRIFSLQLILIIKIKTKDYPNEAFICKD